jgi:hypothetical protein
MLRIPFPTSPAAVLAAVLLAGPALAAEQSAPQPSGPTPYGYSLGPASPAWQLECSGESQTHIGSLAITNVHEVDEVRCIRKFSGDLTIAITDWNPSTAIQMGYPNPFYQPALPWVEAVVGELEIEGNTVDEVHLSRLVHVSERVDIDLRADLEGVNTPSATSLPDLKVTLRSNNSDLQGLDSVSSLGVLSIVRPGGINAPNLNGLNGVTSLDGYTWTGTDVVEQAFLESLTQVDGDVKVQNGAPAPYGLSKVTLIDGTLTINNTAFTNLSGLSNLTTVTGDVVITNNAALPASAAESFANGLVVGGSVTISDNQ